MKNFIKGFRFTPSNYPAEVEAKIQKYRKQGYKLPLRKVLRTPEQLEGIRESAKINTALLDYISENIREGMSTEEIDVMVYDFTTKHGAIPAPLNYEGFPKSVCTSINDVVCHGIPSKTENTTKRRYNQCRCFHHLQRIFLRRIPHVHDW